MSRERLVQELEDTKEQLRKQKTLKVMYINRGKETTRELERLRKYNNDVTLCYAKIATQVRDNTRQKKKDLYKDYEELNPNPQIIIIYCTYSVHTYDSYCVVVCLSLY